MEYPKWIYPAGVLETYEPGQEPVLVQNADEEAEIALIGESVEAEKPKRGRPAKVVEAE